VRRLGHVLGAADQHDLGVTEDDLLGAADHRLEARAAQAIDGERRHRDRHSRAQADVSRVVDGVRRRLLHVAENHVVHVLGSDLRLRQRRLRRLDGEVGGGEVLERAAESAESRALGTDDPDLAG
jgi:hypothetical protein